MSPNTKGEKFAWLDPTSIYINTNAFIDLLDDLLDDLEEIDCDVVAGIDAMGFVLGSALAARLKKGFATIRSVIIEAMIVIIIDSAKTFNAFLSFFGSIIANSYFPVTNTVNIASMLIYNPK